MNFIGRLFTHHMWLLGSLLVKLLDSQPSCWLLWAMTGNIFLPFLIISLEFCVWTNSSRGPLRQSYLGGTKDLIDRLLGICYLPPFSSACFCAELGSATSFGWWNINRWGTAGLNCTPWKVWLLLSIDAPSEEMFSVVATSTLPQNEYIEAIRTQLAAWSQCQQLLTEESASIFGGQMQSTQFTSPRGTKPVIVCRFIIEAVGDYLSRQRS